MKRWMSCLVIVGCGSSSPPAQSPEPAPAPPVDAAVEAAPDAGVPAAVTSAPAWIFRYSTPDRTETFTLQFAEGSALIVYDNGQGGLRYQGTAKDGASLALDVTTGSARLALDCKRAKRSVGATCNDKKARPVDVLDCYHPDFKEPMPFGAAPGIEYVQGKDCTGYRLIATP